MGAFFQSWPGIILLLFIAVAAFLIILGAANKPSDNSPPQPSVDSPPLSVGDSLKTWQSQHALSEHEIEIAQRLLLEMVENHYQIWCRQAADKIRQALQNPNCSSVPIISVHTRLDSTHPGPGSNDFETRALKIKGWHNIFPAFHLLGRRMATYFRNDNIRFVVYEIDYAPYSESDLIEPHYAISAYWNGEFNPEGIRNITICDPLS